MKLRKRFKERLQALLVLPWLWLLYFISGFIPRNAKLWVVGTCNVAMSDNSKYLFLYALRNCPDVRVVWISKCRKTVSKLKSQGLPAAHNRSIEGIWACLTAKYYIYSYYVGDISFWTSRQAILINLWHGTPLKKIGYDIAVGSKANPSGVALWLETLIRPEWRQRPSFISSTSEFVSKNMLCSAFGISSSRCLELGYPRLDVLFQDKDTIFTGANEVEDQEYCDFLRCIGSVERVILYLPTFRDDAMQTHSIELNINALEELCSKYNAVFVIKQHPHRWWSRSQGTAALSERVIECRPDWDVYPIMAFSSILVTDYSSVMFDFVLTRRPIILYTYDLDHYAKNCRDFYFAPQSIGIKTIATTSEELCVALDSTLAGPLTQNYSDEIIERFHAYQDGCASMRTCNFLLSQVEQSYSQKLWPD